MYAFRIPWGGSLAFRVGLLHAPGLIERWQRSLWEDTALYRVLREAGLQLRFVPAVTMVNHETIDLRSCFRFIRRQMLNVRLYHPGWTAVMAHGIGTEIGLAALAGCLGIALATGSLGSAACAGGVLAAYALGAGLGLSTVERLVRRLDKHGRLSAGIGSPHQPAPRAGGERASRRPARGAFMSPLPLMTWLAIPLAHVVYLACLVSAALLRKVDWRGITYEFQGPWDVRLLEYRPYEPADRSPDRSASLV
jgi:hypothetical protein